MFLGFFLMFSGVVGVFKILRKFNVQLPITMPKHKILHIFEGLQDSLKPTPWTQAWEYLC